MTSADRQIAIALLTAGALAGCGAATSRGDGGLPDGSVVDGGPDGGPDAGPDAGGDLGRPQVSRSIALSADGASLWVVNADSDSISQISLASRTLVRELPLGARPPAVDPATSRYDPAVRPRALALVDSLGKIYVAGQAANAVLVVDATSGSVTSIAVGAEPVAVVATADGKTVYAVSHEAAVVSRIDTATDTVTGILPVGEHPWGASLRANGALLYVTQFLRAPAVTVIDTASFTVVTVTALADQPPDPSGVILVPNGQPRGLYTAVPRPNSGELWVPHLLLATGTAQPVLDFESTVFPTYTILAPGGGQVDGRLVFQSESLNGTFPGAFIDVVSGPRDLDFTPDGALALVALAQSEDVMVFDAATQTEVGLVRPTPSSLIEGIVVDATGSHAYLEGRNSHNVTVLDIAAGTDGGAPLVVVDGEGIECLAGADPMAAGGSQLRQGQRLFYTSNSAVYPVTQNFWVACSSCHLEGGTDAVTWKFAQGPRDTPSNAGGPINTGFLFRQAVRNSVIDYDQTIRTEQGGFYHRDDLSQLPDLEALADFTNYAIPFPQNPNLGPDGGLNASQLRGQTLFGPTSAGGVGCVGCHAGTFFTDSGDGNPTLDLGGVVLLHDMTPFTCVTDGGFPDQASTDIDGGNRVPCSFDTPTLRGVFATAPYFHDGSAATVQEASARMPGAQGLSAGDLAALADYVQTL